MNLYLSTRYGNHIDDYGDAEDTNFVVKANSFEEAYDLTKIELQRHMGKNIKDTIDSISLISQINEENISGIVTGPIIDFAYSVSIMGIEKRHYNE